MNNKLFTDGIDTRLKKDLIFKKVFFISDYQMMIVIFVSLITTLMSRVNGIRGNPEFRRLCIPETTTVCWERYSLTLLIPSGQWKHCLFSKWSVLKDVRIAYIMRGWDLCKNHLVVCVHLLILLSVLNRTRLLMDFACASGQNVLLVGPPGSGKTSMINDFFDTQDPQAQVSLIT